jgi:hypothetical protein
MRLVEAMFAGIAKHDDHCWEQVGRCVYCVDCGQRLYQGRIPSDHTNVRTKRRVHDETPRATREMRERWGMDR